MTDGVAADRLRSFIERIERLDEEKAQTALDISEVYAEAKGEGFDPKIMRKIVANRKKDQAQRREEEELLELYEGAIAGLPRQPRRDVRQLDIEGVLSRMTDDGRTEVELRDETGKTLFKAGGKPSKNLATAEPAGSS